MADVSGSGARPCAHFCGRPSTHTRAGTSESDGVRQAGSAPEPQPIFRGHMKHNLTDDFMGVMGLGGRCEGRHATAYEDLSAAVAGEGRPMTMYSYRTDFRVYAAPPERLDDIDAHYKTALMLPGSASTSFYFGVPWLDALDSVEASTSCNLLGKCCTPVESPLRLALEPACIQTGSLASRRHREACRLCLPVHRSPQSPLPLFRYQTCSTSPAHNLLPEKIVCAEPDKAAAMLCTMRVCRSSAEGSCCPNSCLWQVVQHIAKELVWHGCITRQAGLNEFSRRQANPMDWGGRSSPCCSAPGSLAAQVHSTGSHSTASVLTSCRAASQRRTGLMEVVSSCAWGRLRVRRS